VFPYAASGSVSNMVGIGFKLLLKSALRVERHHGNLVRKASHRGYSVLFE
jgi:hypothetical protein